MIEWIGQSEFNGEPVALLSKREGNGKVQGSKGTTLVFAVVPIATVLYILKGSDHRGPFADRQTGHLGGAYVNSLKGGEIDAACHDDCAHKGTLKCYVQHNIQSATEIVKMIRDSFSETGAVSYCQMIMDNPSSYSLSHVDSADDDHLKRDREIGPDGGVFRLMAAGSSGAIPKAVILTLIDALISQGLKPLGYVETWRRDDHLKATHMASCFSEEDRAEAEAAGWSAFVSMSAEDIGDRLPKGGVLCPSSKAYKNLRGKAHPCSVCLMCNGTTDRRRTVYNPRHGAGDSSRIKGLVRRGQIKILMNHSGREVGQY